MKKVILLASVAMLFAACGSEEPEVGELTTEETSEAVAVVYNINPASSSIKWTGTMLGIKEHFGTLQISEGTITVKEGKIVSGSVTVDMTTMAPGDENYDPENGQTKEGLVGHLSSPDFFDVNGFPTATFEITGSDDGGNVVGNLTIRGITHDEVITDAKVNIAGASLTASGNMTYNRQDYDVSFSMAEAYGMADMVISDDIVLELSITASE